MNLLFSLRAHVAKILPREHRLSSAKRLKVRSFVSGAARFRQAMSMTLTLRTSDQSGCVRWLDVRGYLSKVELMHSPFRFLLLLMAGAFGFVVFAYGVSGMLYPCFAVGWPIFLFCVILFLAALTLPIKAGLNPRYFKALTTTVLFNLLFL